MAAVFILTERLTEYVSEYPENVWRIDLSLEIFERISSFLTMGSVLFESSFSFNID